MSHKEVVKILWKAVEKMWKANTVVLSVSNVGTVVTKTVSCPPAMEDNDFVVDSFPLPADKCCSFYLK